MIVPVCCMNCGKLIGDKYDYYLRKLREYKGSLALDASTFDGKKIPETPEARIFKELYIRRYCCKKVFLTHVDLIEKI